MADLAPDWELGRRELVLLGLACRQADMAAALDAVMQRDGPMVRGSKDQQVLHPAIAEARRARLACERLLGALRLPDEAGVLATARVSGDAGRRLRDGVKNSQTRSGAGDLSVARRVSRPERGSPTGDAERRAALERKDLRS
jgi:hypothetical protein